MKIEMETKKIIEVVFYIISMICCFYQIYEISRIYFTFETTTSVRYENEDPLSLPAITLCSHKISFIKKEYFYKLLSNISDEQNESQIVDKFLNYLNNMNISQQLNDL